MFDSPYFPDIDYGGLLGFAEAQRKMQRRASYRAKQRVLNPSTIIESGNTDEADEKTLAGAQLSLLRKFLSRNYGSTPPI